MNFYNQINNDEPAECPFAGSFTYRENYPRLVAAKNKYDPTNFFHLNQNIKPTV
jgi:hypothetical protein